MNEVYLCLTRQSPPRYCHLLLIVYLAVALHGIDIVLVTRFTSRAAATRLHASRTFVAPLPPPQTLHLAVAL